jgi:hypothetical protein
VASLAGEDVTDGDPCWRLELNAASDRAHYARIVYWVAKKTYRPKKLEHYGRTGTLMKVLSYGDYRKGALGLRPMKVRIESLDAWKEDSTLIFTNLRRIDPAPVSFTSDGMIPFRDAAAAARRAGDGTGVSIDTVLRTMAAAGR